MVKAYSNKLADATFFGFCRILFLWTGSIYKLIMWEFIIYFSIYIIYWLVMKFALAPFGHDQKVVDFLQPISEAIQNIPIEFLLGFYVQYVSNRWWEQFKAIPWIDRIAALVRVGIKERSDHPEFDLEVREARRKIIRYMVLGEAWLYRDICPAFEKKLKTEEDILKLGLATKEELKRLRCPSVQHSLYWLPYVWASEIVLAINKKGCTFPPLVRDILRYIQDHRDGVELMYKYYTVPVPLCYTQVVSLAVYGYFFFGLFTNYDSNYVPISLFVKFLVYFGWLKVAESLICPYGDLDDNDFDMVFMLHRNLQVGFGSLTDSLGNPPPSGNVNDAHEEENPDLDSEEEITPRLSPILFAESGSTKKDRISKVETDETSPVKMNDVLAKALADPELAQLLEDMKDEVLVDFPPVTASVLECEKIPKVKTKHKNDIIREFRETDGLVHKAADKYANRKVYLYDVGSKDFVKLRNMLNKKKQKNSEDATEDTVSSLWDGEVKNAPPVPPRKGGPISSPNQGSSPFLTQEKSLNNVSLMENKAATPKESSRVKRINNESMV